MRRRTVQYSARRMPVDDEIMALTGAAAERGEIESDWCSRGRSRRLSREFPHERYDSARVRSVWISRSEAQKVDVALRTGQKRTSSDSLTEQALNDLAIVLGSFQGKLTEKVDAFLAEVQRSGLPLAMIECLLTGGEDAAISSAFHHLYQLYLEDQAEADRLYSGLMTALSEALQSRTKDLPLLLAMTANTRSCLADSTLIEHSLKAFPVHSASEPHYS